MLTTTVASFIPQTRTRLTTATSTKTAFTTTTIPPAVQQKSTITATVTQTSTKVVLARYSKYIDETVTQRATETGITTISTTILTLQLFQAQLQKLFLLLKEALATVTIGGGKFFYKRHIQAPTHMHSGEVYCNIDGNYDPQDWVGVALVEYLNEPILINCKTYCLTIYRAVSFALNPNFCICLAAGARPSADESTESSFKVYDLTCDMAERPRLQAARRHVVAAGPHLAKRDVAIPNWLPGPRNFESIYPECL
ncbi:unnamed protein product [Fusarium fujikuroi]|uniref:Uncharacterized protein n=1 Tax=Fusarium fujikuroi TaxID=5127 RepID=A0A9Q9S4P0_FUSFU|nr:unnamed protein product [Fusarium fujikuroi]VTT83022.1 unnamed protein product [Fusarium fujikuroi]VZH92641.1 unnamed protein product [Fusarium fujikuroi]